MSGLLSQQQVRRASIWAAKRDIDPVLDQCWASVVDAGPTLNQHCAHYGSLVYGAGPAVIQQCANVLCLMGNA